jgi:hypothetical protein
MTVREMDFGILLGKVFGERATGKVWIDGEEVGYDVVREFAPPDAVLRFDWGHAGSGPTNLALAVMMKFADDAATALGLCEGFRDGFLAAADPGADLDISIGDVKRWVEEKTSNEGKKPKVDKKDREKNA